MKNPRKYLEQPQHAYMHIGNMVRAHMELQRITIAEMSRKLHVHNTVFANYLKQPSIQFGILWKIGLALQYNFFGDIAMQFPVEFTNKNAGTLQQFMKEKDDRIKDLEKELAVYKDILAAGFRKG